MYERSLLVTSAAGLKINHLECFHPMVCKKKRHHIRIYSKQLLGGKKTVQQGSARRQKKNSEASCRDNSRVVLLDQRVANHKVEREVVHPRRQDDGRVTEELDHALQRAEI